jgi:hypothetical protein
MKIKTLLAAIAFLLLAAPAHALELGIQDDSATTTTQQRDAWAAGVGATWERTIAYIGQPGTADRIRAAHAAGHRIILTVGGLGTLTRRPSFAAALRYIATLPRADRYTIGNEPDLDGTNPCAYQRGWMKARRILGRRLLFGDFSPHIPVTYTLAARACGPLPGHLDMAVHPYQSDDPLAPAHADCNQQRSCFSQGALGSLGSARTTLRHAGLRVTWWLDEFGYGSVTGTSDAQAALLWPRAIHRAEAVDAQVLVVYMAQGPTWDTRPGEQAWAAIRRTV